MVQAISCVHVFGQAPVSTFASLLHCSAWHVQEQALHVSALEMMMSQLASPDLRGVS